MTIEFYRLDEPWLLQHSIRREDLEKAALSLLDWKQKAPVTESSGDTSLPFRAKRRPWGMSGYLTQSVNGIPLFFKTYAFQRFRDRLRFSLGMSRAVKGYDNIHRLNATGIASPAPVALMLKHCPPCAVLITEALHEGMTLSEWFRRHPGNRGSSPTLPPSADSGNLLEQLALFLRRLHDQGIYHGDLHDANIWLSQDENGHFLFQLLDVEAVIFCRKLSVRRRIKNLRRIAQNLGTAAAMQRLDGEALALEFANYYSDAAGLPTSPRFVERMKAAARRGMKRWKPTNLPD